MKKIEQKMVKAVLHKKDFKLSNTEVVVLPEEVKVKLHGNTIAVLKVNGDLILDSCGWQTPTTKSRLNALLWFFQPNWKIQQKNWDWYLVYNRKIEFPFIDGISINIYTPAKKNLENIKKEIEELQKKGVSMNEGLALLVIIFGIIVLVPIVDDIIHYFFK